MTRRDRLGTVLAWALGGAALLVAGKAEANGYSTAWFGSDHGSPALGNAFSVYFNPAAMGVAKGTQLTLDGTAVFRSASYERTGLTPSSAGSLNDPLYVSANTGKAALYNVVVLPYLGAVTDLGTQNFRLGYAAYVPFGGTSKWDKDKRFADNAAVPGAIDGPQRWHSITGEVLSLYNTLAASYTFEGPRLTIGANASVLYNSLSSVRARNTNGSDDLYAPTGAIIEGRSLIEASGIDWSASLGVLWETADHKLRLGASYTSQPGFRTSRLKGTLTQQVGGIADRAGGTPIDFVTAFPDTVRLGATYRLSDTWEVRGDGTYMRWSVMKNQCVVDRGAECKLGANGADLTGGKVAVGLPRNWNDAYGVRLGVAHWLTPETEIFGSAGLETAAVPKATIDASTIDSTRVRAAIGARHAVSEHLMFAASYNLQYLLPVDNTGQAADGNNTTPSRTPSNEGRYTSTMHMINANVTVAF